MNRRKFLFSSAGIAASFAQPRSRRPNVILILTDDQGFGDLSIHGNEKIQTPNMDRIAREGLQFTQFHVSPVCSPTRSSLLTGRYNYRTGVVDTYLGRSLMWPDETTLAEALGGAGYRTGIFGKWHLGDNYPMRPGDQGFAESVVIKGGGLGQPSDFPGGGSYTDPILLRNGRAENFKGYCTDIFAREAIRYIETNKDRPFFLYLATNAPHTPLEIDEKYVGPFRKAGLDDVTAKVYGMIANVDENIGRVLAKLKDLKLEENTILIFLTDNGPQQKRFNAGMRGQKGTVYEGGIRVPCFVRWPRAVKPGSKVDRLAAHIDVFPTLLEACGVSAPKNVKLDGRSLLPLLRDPASDWPDRTIFFQWHRGDTPELYRDCAARNQRWKLLNGRALYDLENDPAESKDVSAEHADIVAGLRRQYEAWFSDVSATRGFQPSRPIIGTAHENPVILTRQDWRGRSAGWVDGSLGYWEVNVAVAAQYEFRVRIPPSKAAGTARLELNGASLEVAYQVGATDIEMGRTTVRAGEGRLEAELESGGVKSGAHYVTVRKL
ncbi:MAG: arylsulfatase [Bryobacteraceae bacterium]|nr:arylsulfatase [Bryobacteraceae bacterium]